MTVVIGTPGAGCSWQPLSETASFPSKALKCLARSDDFERKLTTRFVIPDELLAYDEDLNGTNPLLRLPTEVLLLLYDAIGNAPTQVAFALTCKRAAAVASRVDMTMTLKSPRYAGFLPVSVFDVPDLMSQLRPWMPQHLRLCGHCLTYRPFSAEYWQLVPGHERNDFWIQKTGWIFKDAGWRKQTHDICPACHYDCSLSDYIPCDGCRALGRLGDVDWARVSDSWRPRPEVAVPNSHGTARYTELSAGFYDSDAGPFIDRELKKLVRSDDEPFRGGRVDLTWRHGGRMTISATT